MIGVLKYGEDTGLKFHFVSDCNIPGIFYWASLVRGRNLILIYYINLYTYLIFVFQLHEYVYEHEHEHIFGHGRGCTETEISRDIDKEVDMDTRHVWSGHWEDMDNGVDMYCIWNYKFQCPHNSQKSEVCPPLCHLSRHWVNLCTLLHDMEWISAPGFMALSVSLCLRSWHGLNLCAKYHDTEWVSVAGVVTRIESLRWVSWRRKLLKIFIHVWNNSLCRFPWWGRNSASLALGIIYFS